MWTILKAPALNEEMKKRLAWRCEPVNLQLSISVFVFRNACSSAGAHLCRSIALQVGVGSSLVQEAIHFVFKVLHICKLGNF